MKTIDCYTKDAQQASKQASKQPDGGGVSGGGAALARRL